MSANAPTKAPLAEGTAFDPGEDTPQFRLLLRIASALQAYGAPAHRLEEALEHCAEHLNTEAQFFSSPTSLLVGLGPLRCQRMRLMRTSSGAPDLAKMVELDALLYEIAENPDDLDRPHQRLDQILNAAPIYPYWLEVLSTMVASAGACVFFRGTTHEIWMATLLSVIVAILPRWVDRERYRRRIFEPTAAFLVALGASVLSVYVVEVKDLRVVLAALIALIPGLGLTVSMTELAMNHLVSGTARLAGVMTVFLTMSFGAGFAHSITNRILPQSPDSLLSTPEPLPGIAMIIATLISPLAFAVLFRARPKEVPIIWLAAVAGVVVSQSADPFLGPRFSAFLSSMTVAVLANLLARVTKKPALVMVLPGILLLVPGSLAFRSLDSFMINEVQEGTQRAFETIMVAICLVGGLLSGNTLFPPRRPL